MYDVSSGNGVTIWHQADDTLTYIYSKCLPLKDYKVLLDYYTHSEDDRPEHIIYRNDEIVFYELGYIDNDNWQYWWIDRFLPATCSNGQDLWKVLFTPALVNERMDWWKTEDESSNEIVWQSYYTSMGAGGLKYAFLKCLDPKDYKVTFYYYTHSEDDRPKWEVSKNGLVIWQGEGYFNDNSGLYYSWQILEVS